MLGRQRASIGLATLVVGGLACSDGEFDVDVEPIELGVVVRLEAVTYWGKFYAIGSGGLVIDELGNRWDLPATLHDVIEVASHGVTPRLLVVGSKGFVASARFQDGEPLEFELEDAGTDADLWAVAVDQGAFRVVIVGDEVLIVGTEDEQGDLMWMHPPAPPGGWGRLRDVNLDARCAIGQEGRMVCTSGDVFDGWKVVELGTKANLNSFCSHNPRDIVGDAGTILTRDGDGWELATLHSSVDLVACTLFFVHPLIVGADRTLYTIDHDQRLEPLLELDWQPRALDPQFGVILVGDGGRAGYLDQSQGTRLQ